MTSLERWWDAATTIYQIYPATFADSGADGVGDLEGIRSRLPYLRRLGVESIWLSPIYPSAGADGGYDVSDYQNIDPLYGSLEDFDALLRDAHGHQIRVLLDFVPNHTSDEHPWFVESRQSRDSPRRDWYIWRDPAPDGGPPNAWRSTFGGPAWRWEERTGQYVMTTFYPQQIDLNWENPDVRQAVTAAMRWWVDRGVDGFRLDVVHRLSKGPNMQNGPRSHEYVREIRGAVGDGTLLLGEVWIHDLSEVVKYVAPGELDLAFAFPFAFARWTPAAMSKVIAEVVERWGRAGALPCWHIGNHDMPRPATRWGLETVRAAAVLELTLPGMAVVYQGDELGMTDGEVPPERARDRIGRDGCRTPMRWTPTPNGGFCPEGVEPYLPVGRVPPEANVEDQEADADSVMALYRRLLALRRSSPALSAGELGLLEARSGRLVYERRAPQERMVVVVNMIGEPSEIVLPRGQIVLATSVDLEGDAIAGEGTTVAPFAAIVVRCD